MSSFQVLDENCSHYPEVEAQEFREVCAELQVRESLLYTPTAQYSSGLLPLSYCEQVSSKSGNNNIYKCILTQPSPPLFLEEPK